MQEFKGFVRSRLAGQGEQHTYSHGMARQSELMNKEINHVNNLNNINTNNPHREKSSEDSLSDVEN
jgi:hypothetical protein